MHRRRLYPGALVGRGEQRAAFSGNGEKKGGRVKAEVLCERHQILHGRHKVFVFHPGWGDAGDNDNAALFKSLLHGDARHAAALRRGCCQFFKEFQQQDGGLPILRTEAACEHGGHVRRPQAQSGDMLVNQKDIRVFKFFLKREDAVPQNRSEHLRFPPIFIICDNDMEKRMKI